MVLNSDVKKENILFIMRFSNLENLETFWKNVLLLIIKNRKYFSECSHKAEHKRFQKRGNSSYFLYLILFLQFLSFSNLEAPKLN